jgi:hypothetical protein
LCVEPVIIRSLGELVDRVTPDEPDPATGRRRDSGVYRGVGDAHWPMLTSLDRLGGTEPPHTKCSLEEHILRNFARYSRPHVATPPASDWELLAQAQHHGVPTRLLDWTYSPLVAAHFATMGRRAQPAAQGGGGPGTDRVIWRLDWQRVHAHFGLPRWRSWPTTSSAARPGGRPAPFTPWALIAAATRRAVRLPVRARRRSTRASRRSRRCSPSRRPRPAGSTPSSPSTGWATRSPGT